MSFGFPLRQVEPLQEAELYKALNEADRDYVTMFAAASNNGNMNSIPFPANDHRVIPMGACNGKGKATDFTPGAVDLDNFCILGVDVISAWPSFSNIEDTEKRNNLLKGSFVRKPDPNSDSVRDELEGTCKCLSGTSFSTPLAAALAALLLQYYRSNIGQDSDRFSMRKFTRLLRKLSRTDGHDKSYHYLVPWLGRDDEFDLTGTGEILDIMKSLFRL
jgi:hypothetical protein